MCAQLCPTICGPMDCRLHVSSVHRNSPGKNTGVGCHFLLQGIFPTQGSNPGLLHLLQWLVASLSLCQSGARLNQKGGGLDRVPSRMGRKPQGSRKEPRLGVGHAMTQDLLLSSSVTLGRSKPWFSPL